MKRKAHGGLSNFGTHKAAPFKKGGGRQQQPKTPTRQHKSSERKTR